jgi:PAS domain S-box-containing protein
MTMAESEHEPVGLRALPQQALPDTGPEATSEALRASEERYRALVEGSIQGIYINQDFVIRFANPAMAQIFGYARLEDLVGRDLSVLLAPHEVARVRAHYEAQLQDEAVSARYEVEGIRHDGTSIWIENLVSTVSWMGRPAVLGTFLDITERRRAEARLRRREQEFRALVDHAPDVVMRFDKAWRHVYVNAAAQRAGGLPAEALMGKTHRQLGLPRSLCELWESAFQKVFESGQETVMEFDTGQSGPVQSFEARLAPEYGSDGSVETVLVVSRDISGRRLLEEQLRQSQRMEAVGKLAGGVAHDFNNLLTVIQGRAEIIRSKLGPAHALRRDVELIHTAAERGAMLTRQLLAFSRKQVLKPKVLDVASVVDGMASMLRRVIGEDIDLRIEHRRRGACIEADPGQIEQLIMNLAVNARDAMPSGGRLTIATTPVNLDAAAAERHPPLAPGPYVTLSVSDTGCGMDAEIRAHLFEPFFTTKERGKGTGLGLSTVYGIVQQHGGSIVVETEVGRGSAFVVLLPRLPVPASDLGTSAEAGEPPRGAETVLLVEDEEQVRAFARETLETAGYTVLEAADPGRALRLASEHAGAIHVVLTDLVMPEMSGRELAERLKSVRPGIRVAYMSGYTDDAIIAHGMRDRNASFLQKPFGRGSLARLVREALDRPRRDAPAP